MLNRNNRWSHFEIAQGVIRATVDEFLKNRHRWQCDIHNVLRHYHNQPFGPVIEWCSGICGQVDWNGIRIYNYDYETILYEMTFSGGPISPGWGEGCTIDMTQLRLEGTDLTVGHLLNWGKKTYRSIDDPWEICEV